MAEVGVPTVCIVGGGGSGLAMLKTLTRSDVNFKVALYELSADVSGLWYHTEHLEDIGGPGKLYRNLRTNGPKQLYHYVDFPHAENVETWLKPQTVKDYLINYSKAFDLYQHIKLEHEVLSVKKNRSPEPNNKVTWNVTTKCQKGGETITQEFDYVIVCSGCQNYVHKPTFPGQEKFKGTIIHSSDYRIPEVYKDSTVLLVGSKPSAWDMVLDVATEANTVLMSIRSGENFVQLPSNCREVRAPLEFTENTALLDDGSEIRVDHVLLCTGYQGYKHFPFLDESCRLGVRNHYMHPVYRGMFHVEHPSLAFVGIWDFVCTLPLAELMAMYIEKVLSAKLKLPPPDVMLKTAEEDYQGYVAGGGEPRFFSLLGPERQLEYVDFLCSSGGFEYPRFPFHLYTHIINVIVVERRFHNYRKQHFKQIDDAKFEVYEED